MAAKDYVFCEAGVSGRIYLAKKTKTPHLMSQDRRLVEDSEAIGCFEAYLRRYCKANNTDTVQISDGDGKVIFEATLKDKEEED